VNGYQLDPDVKMKSRLTTETPVLLLFAITLTLLTAWVARAADNPPAAKPVRNLPAPPAIDPNTGLPLPPPRIDPNWKDPDKVLPEVVYDALPLGAVVEHLRQEFKGAFDILIPNGWQDPNNSQLTADPQAITIKMQLKHVTASEVFNAMNLLFETENSPYRWELKLNGNRSIAILRVLPELLHFPDPPRPAPPTARMVYFVGDLIGDDISGGMTMERLVKTVSDVYEMSFAHNNAKNVLQFHKDAQLVIVTGTSDEIGFVQQTLSALRAKMQAERKPQPKPSPEPKAKTDETKPR
jgi:hypothetical protein